MFATIRQLQELAAVHSVVDFWRMPKYGRGYSTGYPYDPYNCADRSAVRSGYICYGFGEFDGQGSGHDFYGTLYMPPSGYVNSCDGGRSHTYCDYRQE